MEYNTSGRHVMVDAYGINEELLDDANYLKAVMIKGAEMCGASVVSVQQKQFEPQGVTILLLLSESHFSIHTYPEKGFAGIDCYTCGTPDPNVAINFLLEVLCPKKVYVKSATRGIDAEIITE